MPTHSKARPTHGDSDHKPRAAGGGAGKTIVATGSRNAVTGQKLGRAARRGLIKNAEACEEFLTICHTSRQVESDLTAAALTLARIVRPTGAGRVEALLQTGETVSLPIAGSIKFKGGAGTKTDRANCMGRDDIIVIRGAQAAGKFSGAAAQEIQRIFARIGVSTPRGFFAEAAAEEGDDVIEFDRSDDRTMAPLPAVPSDRRPKIAAVDDGDVDIDAI
jgi:hypothetical protein